ncbi:LEAF RUST 10 DISEASE-RESISTANCEUS RECEPTOR-LIKE PROTEIN KINASE-like 2.4 isoform X3 [Gossypium hirsutum]|uniref:LEAF RUST 10 DISEASE-RESISTANCEUS RECEPTOR-LIKE PROTEIN KINASE-like 2.4 isoform X3 n=1 Tax=Gossypium hirsutum TaxID=3635 RepID=A0ABM3B5I6_GOSHI|nr:LEAF RUST 10 DISEASE-RESISTANCE LOCUS RECEPTOR-LIKE PROTEIN KINASE-like 2.4 isoform X3 [Gossypium hirsutum]
MKIRDVRYRVLEILPDRQILRILSEKVINKGICPPPFPDEDWIQDSPVFTPGPGFASVTLFYDCLSRISPDLLFFTCNKNYDHSNVSVAIANNTNIHPEACLYRANVMIPETSLESLRNHSPDWKGALETGFEVQWRKNYADECWKCNSSGGACGFIYDDECWKCNSSGGACGFIYDQAYCYCPPGKWSGPEGKECRPHTGLTVGVTVATIVLVSFIVLRFKRKSLSNHPRQGDKATIEAFIKNFGSSAPKRYSYREIKKITNKFQDNLGQGGFGKVYKGKMSDGRFVAVKVLNEFKGNGEDFMNEVASISRTSHVNIVTLLGFCFERSKRALIYEFMPHGSLDKFIYSQGSNNQSRRLEWKTLYDIVLGIARGLEYLHQGCNTRILHFDIKPHNILLDKNFCPKISDFGLSKLCERKESIISMACPRGTVGYIAPEVYCRNFGGVSNKSDVYSYGMMVLEMVGGRKNIDVGVSQTSEVYFPSWIYEHIDQSMNLNLKRVIAKEEEEITRKLIIVSLWCIQHDPCDRPSMTKVLEMLQGSLQSLVIPPKPFVSSLLRSPVINE